MDTAVNTSAGGSGLPGIGALLSSAWRVFRERWKLLVGLAVLPLVVWVLSVVLVPGGAISVTALRDAPDVGIGAMVTVALLFVVGLLFNIVAAAAQTFVAGSAQRVTFSAAFRWGFSRLLPLIGLGILWVLLAFLALLPLLIVWTVIFFLRGGFGQITPGITFGVLAVVSTVAFPVYVFLVIRLVFTSLLVTLKESSVLNSFKESWRLTSGRFWPLLWRAGFVTALTALASTVVGFVPILGAAVLQPLLQVVVSVYLAVYFVVLLRATQRIAGFPSAPPVPAA